MSLRINDLFSVAGKTVVITGGSRGIGEMIARAYVENGAKVILTSRKAADVEGLAVQLKDDEVAVFAWIVYASRAERDRINALVMKDPRIDCKPEDMPFDGMRMFWGGFTGLVELGWGAAPGA